MKVLLTDEVEIGEKVGRSFILYITYHSRRVSLL